LADLKSVDENQQKAGQCPAFSHLAPSQVPARPIEPGG
jgi:hypothetical protein